MDLQTLRTNMAKAKADFQKFGQDALKVEFTKFFLACPEIESIYWTQFTPYFNDGDACTFSVGEPQFKAPLFGKEEGDENEEDEEESIDEYYENDLFSDLHWKREGRSWKKISPQPLSERETALFNEMKSFKTIFSEDELFEAVFGDHMKVKATRFGFEAEEYDHE